MKARKQKVVSISDEGLIGIRIMAARLGVSTRVVVDMILDTVGMDSDLQERILECQENDLERKENQNGTSGKSISDHRKMNPTDRKMTHQENKFSGGELVVSKSDKMFNQSYQKKTVLPNSVNGESGHGASPLPVFSSEPYAGIPVVSEGEWKLRDGALFITSGGKKGVVELFDVDSEYTHKRIIVSHNGEQIEIDLTAKSGKL